MMAMTPRAARINVGLNQNEAAAALNISKNTLSNYEQYKTVPDIKLAKRMAQLYQCSVDDIIFFKH